MWRRAAARKLPATPAGAALALRAAVPTLAPRAPRCRRTVVDLGTIKHTEANSWCPNWRRAPRRCDRLNGDRLSPNPPHVRLLL